jgi:hypothetical protein
MRVIESKNFTADRSWGSLEIANMNYLKTFLEIEIYDSCSF